MANQRCQMQTRSAAKRVVPLAILGMAMVGVASCSDVDGDVSSVQGAVGEKLGTVDAADFAEVSDAFGGFEGLADGLGPIFNAQACGQCHSNGATGGAGEQIERRFGRFVNGAFDPQ